MRTGSAHAVLRDRTRGDHERVDAAFADFDLTSRDGYAAFLRAHASVLPGLERELAPARLLMDWTGRTAALHADLAALDEPIPSIEPANLPDGDAARWGALYVVGGSRLGGAMLAQSVGDEFPAAYLRSTHSAGSWRRLLATMEQALKNPRDLDEAVASAKGVFVAYRHAAEQERNF
jgi:heme oxygenase